MSSPWPRGTSMIGKPDVFGVYAPSRSRESSTAAVLRHRPARISSSGLSFTARPSGVDVRVVDVEEGVVLAGEPRERANVRGVAGHAVHAVDADEPRSAPVLGK